MVTKYMIFLLMLGCIFNAQGNQPKSPEEGGAFEGDMILTADQLNAIEEQVSGKNSFAAIKTGLWLTNGKADIISYYIDPTLYQAEKYIENALEDYHKYTCLRFKRVDAKPNRQPHLHFYRGSGCSSYVGRMSYGNQVSLAGGCWGKGTILHEVGHAIGLYHEQSRPDRDDYVTIKWNNIHRGMEYNFNKYSSYKIDSRGSPYDYDSMMHYGSRYFSNNGKFTIETKHPEDQRRIGTRNGFSKIDIEQINKMYNCKGTTNPTPKTTHQPQTTTPTTTQQPQTATPKTTQQPKTTTPKTTQQPQTTTPTTTHKPQTATPKTTQQPETTTPKTTQQPQTTPILPGCVDNDENCWGWTIYCNNNDYVIENCKKTCKRCGNGGTTSTTTTTTAIPRCMDNNKDCIGWKLYCGKHQYVDKYCKKTCNKC